MRIRKYEEFVNEEISKKTLLGGALAGTLALGGLATGGAYMRDKGSQPTEQISQVKKEIPNNFMINEELLTIGHDFWITNKGGENFGKIEQRVFSWGKKFEYFDNTGKLDVTAQEEVFSLYSVVHIKDSNGKEIGKIEAEILESLGNLLEGQNVYSIYDGNNNLIGKSKSDIIIKNNIEIYDNNDKLVAKFHKPAIQFGDRWSCEVVQSNIDKRLMIFIPAYISSKSSSSSSSSRSSK
jgi:uncharacterized protein YxjI